MCKWIIPLAKVTGEAESKLEFKIGREDKERMKVRKRDKYNVNPDHDGG